MIKYRILEEQADGTWTPFGVAYNRGEYTVLFVPAWRAHKRLARPLEDLGAEDYPSHTFRYRWRELQTAAEPVSHPIDLLQRAFHPDVIDELLKIVRGMSQKLASLVCGDTWQPLLEGALGLEAEDRAEDTPRSQKRVLKLTSGPLEGAEVEHTSADRLVITLNRPVPAGSHLKLITEIGEELTLPVVRPLDRQGRVIYDLSGISESPAFRLVLVAREDHTRSDK